MIVVVKLQQDMYNPYGKGTYVRNSLLLSSIDPLVLVVVTVSLLHLVSQSQGSGVQSSRGANYGPVLLPSGRFASVVPAQSVGAVAARIVSAKATAWPIGVDRMRVMRT